MSSMSALQIAQDFRQMLINGIDGSGPHHIDLESQVYLLQQLFSDQMHTFPLVTLLWETEKRP